MNYALLDECFRLAGRTTWYHSPKEIQRDLERFPELYNLKRSHQGYRLKSRNTTQALREALGPTHLPPVLPKAGAKAEREAAQSAIGDALCRAISKLGHPVRSHRTYELHHLE